MDELLVCFAKAAAAATTALLRDVFALVPPLRFSVFPCFSLPGPIRWSPVKQVGTPSGVVPAAFSRQEGR